jgi:putative transposase
MEERHLLACARYVEINPVRAGLVAAPEAWPWSSAAAHLARQDDGLARSWRRRLCRRCRSTSIR